MTMCVYVCGRELVCYVCVCAWWGACVCGVRACCVCGVCVRVSVSVCVCARVQSLWAHVSVEETSCE